MITDAFLKAYKALNTAQKEAVDAIEGPVMLVAGPGTGKTQVLALRIANILKETDTPPDGILCLTFTESGVHAMRSRLKTIIGEDAYKVQIHTFHGYANTIIERFPSFFSHMAGSKALSDLERALLWEEIFRTQSFTYLRTLNDPFFYMHGVKEAIKKAKQEKVSPSELKIRLEKERDTFNARDDLLSTRGKTKGKMKGEHLRYQEKLHRSFELVVAYEAYEEALRKMGRHDYEDMVLSVIDACEKNEELLLMLSEEALYVLVDEHQDTNRAQNRLLELITSFHDEPNLFVVGDEKQAIYRFQGASIENFHGIKAFAPNVRTIALTHNYRSTQAVLDTAHSLVVHGGFEHLDNLIASKEIGGALPILIEARSIQEELQTIAERIRQDIEGSTSAHEIAILFRKNNHAHAISHALSLRHIPHVIESERSIFSVPAIGLFLAYLRGVLLGDEESIVRSLASPWFSIALPTFFSIMRERVKDRRSVLSAMETHPELTAIKSMLLSHTATSRVTPLLSFIETVARETGFLAYAVGREEVYESYLGLFSFAQTLVYESPGATVETLMERLSVMERHHIDIHRSSRVKEGSVRLMTAHKSKGLEFEKVYIVHLIDKEWRGRADRELFILPLYNSTDEHHAIEDERRLLYVAMTRAKQSLTFTYATELFDGKEAEPSRFISELDETLLERVSLSASHDVTEIEHFATSEITATLAELMREHLTRDGLSVTGLNQYLTNPWRFIFSTFLRIPSSKKHHLMYGSAMDKALEKFVLMGKKEKQELIELFNDALEKEPIEAYEFEHYRQRGEKALSILFDSKSEELTLPGEPKRRIKTPYAVGDIEILLSGELDLLRTESDGLVVIDYKTGEAKSRNEIEGKTATSDGGYYRQLAFYKLLVESAGIGEMKRGVLQFVEPDKKGEIHTEAFVITKEDVDNLKEEIKTTVESLLTGRYLDEPCDSETCDYCDLVEVFKNRFKE